MKLEVQVAAYTLAQRHWSRAWGAPTANAIPWSLVCLMAAATARTACR
jgi:hypothetical protein